MEYGDIPQNRERIYIVGLNKRYYNKFEFPMSIPLTVKLSDVIDYHNKVDDKYYYTPDKCKFYDTLKSNMKRMDTVYQWRRVYVRENKGNVSTLL